MTTLTRNALGDIKNSMVAVFDQDADLSSLLESLADIQLQGDITVVQHDGETDLDDPKQQGLLKAIRHAFSDKTVEVEESLTNALRMGKQVVQTHIAEDDDKLKRVHNLYSEHNGEFIHYFGEWSIEVIEDSAPTYSHNT